MSSLAAAASTSVADFFPPPPVLAHSYNSSGRLGMFVNPYNCSCVTCVDYVGERSGAGTAIGLRQTSYPPTPPPSPPATLLPRTDFEGTGCALGRAPANPTWDDSEWVPTESEAPAAPRLTRSLTLGIGPSLTFPRGSLMSSGWGRGPTTTDFGRPTATLEAIAALPATVEEVEESDGAAAPASAPAAPGLRGTEEDDVMARLQTLRARLLTQQDNCHEGPFRSHDEMAAADAEWDELDTKIHAIEELLSAFHVPFRTR
jgi:hypothetical protein